MAKGCSIGFEVMAFVGLYRWHHHKQIKGVKTILESMGVDVSTGEISILSDEFLLYLQEAHLDASTWIEKLISSQGGYIMQVDGT